jgi:hypothetical protein
MENVYVYGDFDSGLTIEADLPQHLAGGQPQTRGIILTPSQAERLWQELLAKRSELRK